MEEEKEKGPGGRLQVKEKVIVRKFVDEEAQKKDEPYETKESEEVK